MYVEIHIHTRPSYAANEKDGVAQAQLMGTERRP